MPRPVSALSREFAGVLPKVRRWRPTVGIGRLRGRRAAAFWRGVQERLKEGEVLEVLPYHPHRVRVASSA